LQYSFRIQTLRRQSRCSKERSGKKFSAGPASYAIHFFLTLLDDLDEEVKKIKDDNRHLMNQWKQEIEHYEKIVRDLKHEIVTLPTLNYHS
jgi:chromosome segregation ATPase